jgi:cold shock protein
VGAVTQGKVIRFDQIKGYGFISPRNGGEDVFLHVNDLLDDKSVIRPGAVVEFVLEEGERGLKASSVHLVEPPATFPSYSAGARSAPVADHGDTGQLPASSAASADLVDDGLVDVLSRAEYLADVTEALLTIEPGLTGPQIRQVREALCRIASGYGWVSSDH